MFPKVVYIFSMGVAKLWRLCVKHKWYVTLSRRQNEGMGTI